MMPNDLYFIPILFDALGSADIGESLRQAFADIVRLGKDPRLARGYRQFLIFMTAALEGGSETVRDGLADGSTEVMAGLRAFPGWEDLWQELQTDLDIRGEDLSIRLVLRSQADPPEIVEMPFPEEGCCFPGVVPGRYELAVDSGRVLWEATLGPEHVLLAYAFPGTPLQMAADTGQEPAPPTLRKRVLDGALEISVFPGRRSGRLEVRRCVS